MPSTVRQTDPANGVPSDQEARLVTVVTLWSGKERKKLCNEDPRWVRALLATYPDRCLRVQILSAHLPALAQ